MGKTLAVNAGSSTLKFKLFEVPSEKVLTSGAIERIGLGDSLVSIKYGDGKKYENTQDVKDRSTASQLQT